MPTPIGNLGDVSERAKAVLGECDLILAEDTRHTGTLLKHLGLQRPMQSCHEHNEWQRIESVLAAIQAGQKIALVTNAGMPTLSDPGFRLVRAAARAKLFVQALPGPCAVVTALAVSGLPTDRFVFEGFFPRKPGKSRKLAESWVNEPRTIIFYDSPMRLNKTIALLHEVLGARPVVVCRELTKKFEEILRSDLAALAGDSQHNWRGEITVVLAGVGKDGDEGHESDDD